jgi:hypothetical protein
MQQAHLLADLMDHAHAFTLHHVERLKGQDLHHRFEVNGKPLNSAFWIVAHLAVSQNWLILRGTGGNFQKFPWAKQYTLGAAHPSATDAPPWDEVLATYQRIHQLSLDHVRALPDEVLTQAHHAMMDLGGVNTIRQVILHHVRHESSHNGQLGWLCKCYGLPTV